MADGTGGSSNGNRNGNGNGEGGLAGIPADAFAAIFTEDGGYGVVFPEGAETVPPEAAALFACAMRLEADDDFIVEQLDWLEANGFPPPDAESDPEP